MVANDSTERWGEFPRVGRVGLFFCCAFGGLLLDLATKRLLFDWLGMPGEQPVWWLIPHVFGFQTSLNEGALFGIGQGQTVLFVVASILAFVAIGVWFFYEGGRSRLLTAALGLVTAGIAGNLTDRLGLHGLCWPEHFSSELAGRPIHAVRDWILVMIGSWPWPNFNIADSCLVVGTILIAGYAIWFDPKLRDKKDIEPA